MLFLMPSPGGQEGPAETCPRVRSTCPYLSETLSSIPISNSRCLLFSFPSPNAYTQVLPACYSVYGLSRTPVFATRLDNTSVEGRDGKWLSPNELYQVTGRTRPSRSTAAIPRVPRTPTGASRVPWMNCDETCKQFVGEFGPQSKRIHKGNGRKRGPGPTKKVDAHL